MKIFVIIQSQKAQTAISYKKKTDYLFYCALFLYVGIAQRLVHWVYAPRSR